MEDFSKDEWEALEKGVPVEADSEGSKEEINENKI